MLNYFYIYSNLALTYISDMLQIFDNDYVTMTPFSRSFKYIFYKLDSEHTSSSAYWISETPLNQLPAYINIVYIDDISLWYKGFARSRGGHTFTLKIVEHFLFPFRTGHIDTLIYD